MAPPSVLTEGRGDGQATCLEHRAVSGVIGRHGTCLEMRGRVLAGGDSGTDLRR